MKKIVFSCIFLLSFGGISFAGSTSGCGLGSEIFKGEEGLPFNVLAITTNGSFGNNTFGVTTGTLGCKQDDVVYQEKEAEVFIASNYDRILEDAGKGKGEFVAGMGRIMGCEETAFASSVQANYDRVFTGNDAQVVLKNTKALISEDPSLAKNCG